MAQVQLCHLHQLFGDLQVRIERGHRILEDHSDAPAADLSDRIVGQQQQIAAVEEHFA